MSPTRREFIKRVGIAIASLAAARCAWPTGKDTPTPDEARVTHQVVCYDTTVLPTETLPAAGQLDEQEAILTAVARGEDVDPEVARRALIAFYRERLRACWIQLDWLAEQAKDWEHPEKGGQARDDLIAQHHAALDELVAAGELEAAVADEVQNGFDAAVHHIWRANCGVTCYEAMPGPEYTPYASDQLVKQAELLEDLPDDATIDQEAVAKAHVAVERDIAFLNLSSEEEQALYDGLIAAAGDTYDYPPFDELELGITPEAAEAARFLVELLLEHEE